MPDIKRIELDQEPIWSIQFDETATQYRAFCLYRDLLGARSLSRVTEVLMRERSGDEQVSKAERLTPKRAPGVIQGWSARNRWVERADAYELHLEEERRRQQETEIMRMRRTELQFARGVMAGIMRRLFGYTDDQDPTQNVEAIKWNEMTAGEMALLARLGIETGRLATNQPTSLVKAALMVTSSELSQISADITEMAMRYIPDERKPMFAEEIRSYSQGDRPMLG